MHYRQFGNTDLRVSEIGFGAWAIGGGAMIGNVSIGWGDADDDVSKNALRTAIDAGINFFDTADIYGLGHSETLIGEVAGNNYLVATKVGNVSRDEKFTVDYSKKYILTACEASLRRLQRETIDYYQLHSARLIHLQNGECIEAMQQLQKEGKIRYWGLSLNTFDPFPEANYLIENNLGHGLQLVLNLLNQKALPLIRLAAKKKYGIIARMPLQFGLLTGKFDSGVNFATNDHRNKRITKEIIDASSNALKNVWALCDKYGINKSQLALSYVLSYREISTVIPGIRTEAHVDQNSSNIVKLEQADLDMIEALGKNEFVSVMDLIEKQG
jgi:aryl-alcohol dehydrogenase-like predicted oxidoreductase